MAVPVKNIKNNMNVEGLRVSKTCIDRVDTCNTKNKVAMNITDINKSVCVCCSISVCLLFVLG